MDNSNAYRLLGGSILIIAIAVLCLDRSLQQLVADAVKEHVDRIEDECGVEIYERDGQYVMYDPDDPQCCPQPPFDKGGLRRWKDQIEFGRVDLQEILARIERECQIDLREVDGKLEYTPIDPHGCSPISDGSL